MTDYSPQLEGGLLESLAETRLYSIGALFTDRHPELVDDVIAESEAIEQAGLEGYAAEQDLPLPECFQTLMTGLAIRYFRAVAGEPPAQAPGLG